MSKKIEDVLDECLERIFRGEGIEDCLNAYPAQAPKLEPLLKASLAFMQRAAAIRPDPELKARARSQLRAVLYAKREREEKRARILMWRRRWAVAMTTVLVVLLAGMGTVAASASALPDGPLYPVRLAVEEARLNLAFSNVHKAKLRIQFAERSANQITQMAREGKTDKILVLTEQVASHLDHLDKVLEAERIRQASEENAEALAPVPALRSGTPPTKGTEDTYPGGEGAYTQVRELEAVLSESRAKSLELLRNALDKAPEEIKPILEQGIKNIRKDYDEALFTIESYSG